MGKLSTITEFMEFLRSHKKTWMIPIVLILLFFGLILVAGQGSALAPFIYSIF